MDQRRPSFALTDMERRTLIVLGVLLVIGLAAKQVQRWARPEQPIRVSGVPVVSFETEPADDSSVAGDSSIASSSLATSPSHDVPSHARSLNPEPPGTLESALPREAGEPSLPVQPDMFRPGPAGEAAADSGVLHIVPATDRFELNAITQEELESLPGIGPVLAQRILDWRTAHGSFQRVEDLLLIDGIGEKRLANLKLQVFVQHQELGEQGKVR